jgi:hypothetical protein
LITIVHYTADYKTLWDDFVENAKNGIFSLKRDFVEYHQNRFQDASLLIFKNEKLVALLPANSSKETFFSHQGLTWAGFVVSNKITTELMLEVVESLIMYLKAEGYKSFLYKAKPHIFSQLSSEEDLYALFRHNASIEKREVSSVINLQTAIHWSKGNKWIFNKAKNNLILKINDNFDQFMDLEKELLQYKYKTIPTHSIEEILYLKSKFPNNIFLLNVFKEDEYLGGTIYYVFKNVIHTQYIGFNEIGKKHGAITVTMNYLIEKYASTHQYLSFGISTENNGLFLNKSLIKSKENLGASAIVHDTYRINL